MNQRTKVLIAEVKKIQVRWTTVARWPFSSDMTLRAGRSSVVLLCGIFHVRWTKGIWQMVSISLLPGGQQVKRHLYLCQMAAGWTDCGYGGCWRPLGSVQTHLKSLMLSRWVTVMLCLNIFNFLSNIYDFIFQNLDFFNLIILIFLIFMTFYLIICVLIS